MGYVTTPIPEHWTWYGSETGRVWSTVGTQLELTVWEGGVPPLKWDVDSWDWSVWGAVGTTDRATVEYRTATTPPGGAWSSYAGRVLTVDTRTGPGLWYQGPKAGGVAVLLEQTQNPALRPAIGDEIRVLVTLNSGRTVPLWHGRVQTLQDQYTQGLTTLLITGTCVIGWAFQAGTDSSLAVADIPSDVPAGNVIDLLFVAAWFADMDPAYTLGVDRGAGFTAYGYDTSIDVAVSTAVGEQVRGDLGLLYTDRFGVLQWLPHNWWDGTGFQAAIGSDRLAAPIATPFAFPASTVVTSETLVDVINQVVWTRKDDLGATVGVTTQPPTAPSLAQFGRRQRSDSVKLFIGADAVNAAAKLKFALENGGKRITQVTFPADTNEEAQQFAYGAAPGQAVYVLEESIVSTVKWTAAHVIAVTHRLTPEGWDVTLSLETRTVGLSPI